MLSKRKNGKGDMERPKKTTRNPVWEEKDMMTIYIVIRGPVESSYMLLYVTGIL